MLTYKVKTGGQILLIPIDDILPPPYSSRIIISSEELEMLSESIKENGLLTPVSVKSIDEGRYQIISGERRRRAALLAGLTYLPCLLMQGSDEECRIINIADNLHRRELHFLEVAEAIEKLRDYMSVERISEELCIPEGLILSRIRLLSLPENIKWKIISGSLSENTANALCRITDEKRQNAVVDIMISAGLGIREALEATALNSKKSVFVAHYKDYTVFENTIDHAIETMTASGISAKREKTVSKTQIVYTVTIDKMI